MTADLAEDQLRLAREAARAGRAGRREALLTLAAASAARARLPWADRCREALLAARPDHLFAHFPTLDAALADPRVARSLGRLDATFPAARVRRLLMAADVLAGPYPPRRLPVARVLDELLSPAVEPPSQTLGIAFPIPPLPAADAGPEALGRAYARVLLSLALLLQGVLSQPVEGARAA